MNMYKIFLKSILLFFLVILSTHFLSSVSMSQGRSTITGIVYGAGGKPIPDLYVELLTDNYSTIRRVKTNGTGLYNFRGLTNGYYRIRVLTFGTTYGEQTKTANLVGVSAIPGKSVSVNQQVDFQLYISRDVNAGPLAAPGVIFIQEVPKEAEKLYEEGIKFLSDKNDKEGFAKLKKSLEVFPDYYLALDRLGTEYVVRGYYRPAYVLLTKALEQNSNSYSSNLGLGITQFKLNLINDSINSISNAIKINDELPTAHLWLGISLLEDDKLIEAESSLNKANKLSNGKSSLVYWQLAKLYNKQSKFKEAADSLEKYLKYTPDVENKDKIIKNIERLRSKTNTNT